MSPLLPLLEHRKQPVCKCFVVFKEINTLPLLLKGFLTTYTRTMRNLTIYLSTAPVVALIWFTFTAALVIEINRFFPDPLVFSF